MSVAATVAAGTKALLPLLTAIGQRQPATLTELGETWATSGPTFRLKYEPASPISQGQFDYQAPAGYAFDVKVLPSQAMDAGDRIVVPAVGMTFQVVDAPPVGSMGMFRLLRCKLVTS